MIKTPTKANLNRRKPRGNLGKFADRIFSVNCKKLHQNSFKSLIKPTISLNLLVLSLILYKCLHFFDNLDF
jgi:hypothetical protein